MMVRLAARVATALLCTSPGFAGDPPRTELLPPLAKPWTGASELLIAPTGARWTTPAESTDFDSTPTYDQTVEWLSELVSASPLLSSLPIGTSREGREILMIVASASGAKSAADLRSTGLPIMLAQAGIHAGEIDGKDAGLMLLRDLVEGGRSRYLLDQVNFLFIPILNVDGHERRSPFGRINQRGPEAMGWRTNARNLNLNRDYSKVETIELRAVLATIEAWKPDLYVDLHVTDGVDYQYDITWGSSAHGYSPRTAAWMTKVLDPFLHSSLRDQGHIPGPLVFPKNWGDDLSQGLREWRAGPRFSDSYGSIRHLPTVLVENHSLKPYRQRVLGTRVLLEAMLDMLGAEGESLRSAVRSDCERRPSVLPVSWKSSNSPKERITFLGIESHRVASAISGTDKVVWTGRPVEIEVDMELVREPDLTVSRPTAYLVPPAWSDIIDRLRRHGVVVEIIRHETELDVEMYRIERPSFSQAPFEGRLRVSGDAVIEAQTVHFPAGTARVSTDQPLGDLAMLLLEPISPDSFFQWGYFLEIFSRTEYVEGYVVDPMAERMLAEDPRLAEEFAAALEADRDFAASPEARRQWFYEKTPYWDDRFRLYPIARLP